MNFILKAGFLKAMYETIAVIAVIAIVNTPSI